MRVLGSLTNRIFLATALMAVFSVGLAIFVVNIAVTRQAEDELARRLEYAAALVEQNRDLLVERLAREARLVADLPKLKAAVGVDHPPTLEPIALDYQDQLQSDLFLVTNSGGRVLADTAQRYPPGQHLGDSSAIQTALEGQATISFWPSSDGGTQVVTVPIWIDEVRPELLGTLSVGFHVDRALANRIGELTDSEIAFVVGGSVHAMTLPTDDAPAIAGLRPDGTQQRLRLRGEQYAAIAQTFSMGDQWSSALDPSMQPSQAPVAVVLQSRTAQLAFRRSLQTALIGTGLLGVLFATLLSYAVTRTVTRPVDALLATMREMAATGDLTKRISLPDPERWTDDDTRLLAGTFNAMTDSIARFQQEASQRERLSSLGRLSTVIAHEIRNPLMIIKAALRTLRRHPQLPDEAEAAAGDIDEEVDRLNRIVGEVLDFARPIRFELSELDLNDLCADAVAAVSTDTTTPTIATSLDPAAAAVFTDRERLRLALINVLTNARDAVSRKRPAGRDGERAGEKPPIELRTQSLGADRIAIEVRDEGEGIGPDDLPRLFDPYFTTTRTGSGLGLAITRNVVEGLGGTVTVRSQLDKGTTLQIELPRLADQKTDADDSRDHPARR